MITKINKFALLLLMLCCTLSVSAASEAEYKKLAKTWTLNANGSQEFRYNMELTLYTHAAMNSKYGESFIVYNPQYQTLKINKSYTKQKDGNIVKTPANAFVEVLPKNAADAPAYNHLKEMVVVHTGLELGATIYLDYTITSKPGYLPELDIFETIQQASPIREYTLTTVTPSNKEVRYTLANSGIKAVTKEKDGKKVTAWTLHNVPQVSTSAFVSVSNGDLPYLAATTYENSKTALRALNKQMNVSDNQLKDLVAKVTKGSKCEKCKMKKIIGFIANNLSTSALTLEQTGYRFRSADEVLATAYGTEVEKANLMAAMLQAAGLKAEVLAGYPVQAGEGLALKAINHLYVAVDGESYIFPIGSLARPQQVIFGQSPVYKLADGTLMAVEASQKHQITGKQTVTVKEGKWIFANEEIVGDDLLPYFLNGKMNKETSEAVKVQNGYATLVLKESANGINSLGYGRLNSRRDANLVLPRLVDETYSFEIDCQESMRLCTPAQKKEIHNLAGDLVLSVEKNGQKATVTRSLKLSKQLYTPSEYKYLRELLVAWSDINAKTLLFSVE